VLDVLLELVEKMTNSGVPGKEDLVKKTYVIAKFHYTGLTGPDETKSADFVGDPGLRPGSREKVRSGPCSGI